MGSQHEWHDSLRGVVAEMQAAVELLREALDTERAALDAADPQALDSASAAKAERLQALEALDAERRTLVRSAAAGCSDVDIMANVASWSQVLSGLDACRHKNQVNGGIVSRRLAQVRGALAVLTGAGEAAPLYGASGGSVVPLHSSVYSRA
ncbi:flagellar protein FlgN [Oleiagrimonas sp. C23AA]|uniref:flagella synthesis protein FlgN n=1 Tax=Oleiagrimonas sp. C23AA TaxID=2719047 RepID=UPI00141E4755|nr:flagellar protein FlgN [Oleiagrimonas sp. C23AA]NII09219.1 flagellar protein FlgN [Oleiagrimonas sp. C23AA]